jgi:hypothetical protein
LYAYSMRRFSSTPLPMSNDTLVTCLKVICGLLDKILAERTRI